MKLPWTGQKSLTPLVVLVGGILVIGLWVGKPGPRYLPPPPMKPPLVDIVIAEPGERTLPVETQGTVRPLREVKLISQVSGMVESVSPSFAVGEFFAAGDQLLKVEDVDYRFDIARAQARVAAARQVVAEERGRALQAKREWRELGSKEANDLFLRKPQNASAEAALVAARADLAEAKLDLERTSISAPFNGRISDKFVDVGQSISPGTHIATVYDTDLAQVKLPLTGRQVALLDLPLSYDSTSHTPVAYPSVVFTAEFANRSWEWHGKIVRTDAIMDVNSRVVYAVAEIDKPFAQEPGSNRPPLYPGLFVNATITGKLLPAVSVLPGSALRRDGTVLVVNDDNRASPQVVDVIDSSRQSVWLQGLSPGDKVIVGEGAKSLAGTEVTTRRREQTSSGELR